MTNTCKYAICVPTLRKIINESVKSAVRYKDDLKLAKPYWEKATMAANEYADIGEDDPRCKEKNVIIMQKFELNVEARNNRSKRRQEHFEKKLMAEEKKNKEELDRKERKAKYLEKRKEVLNLIESRLDEIKNISHLITVRQIKKMLLDSGDIESYRTSKVLHSAARKAVIWHDSMLAIKGVEKEIDEAADLYTLKRVIDFLKREDFCECSYYYVGSEKCYTLDWKA